MRHVEIFIPFNMKACLHLLLGKRQLKCTFLFIHDLQYIINPTQTKCLINYDKNINVCTKSVNFLNNFTCTLTFHFMCEQNLMTWNLNPYFFGTLCLPFNFNKKIMFLQNLMTELLNPFIYTLCIPFNVQIKL